ncbi:hypothetical protein DMN91_010966 [Ooceraea biroi]|uniref:Ig-like domain-containing protein n=1 Tax=Ooceraea biroi TaxID=2015173 RepID=A0A3L8D8Q0_OOCBI|nr:hypothetical protein DMN91_010966 [Ooceraea biroi]
MSDTLYGGSRHPRKETERDRFSGNTMGISWVPLVNISVVEGRPAELPCDITPPGEDTLHMVFWFKDEAGVPLYT